MVLLLSYEGVNMTNKELFEKIHDNHKEKKVLSCAKKLIKKCSFSSGTDAGVLCELAYWLYIYGYINEVHEIYEITKELDFPGKGSFAVWDYLFFIWGLEIYLLKLSGNEEDAKSIIDKMDECYQNTVLTEEQEHGRRNNIDYDMVSQERNVSAQNSLSRANSWRITALFTMIGLTYTGFYPKLNSEIDKIEIKINEYIEILRKVK